MPCKGKGTCCMFIGVKNQQSKSCPSCMLHPSWPDICPYQKLSSYLKQCGSYGQHKILASGEIIMEKVIVLLNTTCLLVLIYASTKYYQNISNHTLKDLKKVRIVSLALKTPTGTPLHLYQILSYYLKKYGSYGLHKISASGEITTSGRKWEMSFLHGTCLLFISTKHYQNMSKSSKVMERTRFWFQGR